MALKAVVDSLDSIPEGIRGEYEDAGDGTFKLKVEGADSLVDTSGFRSTITKLREKEKIAQQWQKAFPDKTPDEIAELIKQAGAGGGEGGEKDKPDLTKYREKVEGEVTQRFKPQLDKLSALEQENRALKLDARLEKMAIEAGVMPERLADAITLYKARFDLDDKGQIIALDEKGEIAAYTPQQAWAEKFKAERAYLFKAPDSTGSGGRGSDKATDTGAVKSKKDLKTAKEKAAFIGKHGLTAFQDLPAE
ncbi:MAG TPA: hypothetical protein VEA99_09870 [Gemmatimonadaceae bacterium]|nr:hypothetical protein [Gemmatimonadaceae bacterium]